MVPSKIKRAAKIKKVNLEVRKPVKVIRKVQKNKKVFGVLREDIITYLLS